jgi:hypothetical protein
MPTLPTKPNTTSFFILLIVNLNWNNPKGIRFLNQIPHLVPFHNPPLIRFLIKIGLLLRNPHQIPQRLATKMDRKTILKQPSNLDLPHLGLWILKTSGQCRQVKGRKSRSPFWVEQQLPDSSPKSYKDEAMHSPEKRAFTLVGYVFSNSFSSSSMRLILE